MLEGLLLVVLVRASEVRAPTTLALEHAVESALGAEARVSVRSVPGPVEPKALAEAAPDADVVARLEWLDAGHQSAALRCYIAAERRVVTRQFSFKNTDEIGERGRLIGLALAAITPDDVRPAATPPPIPAPPVRASETPQPIPAPPVRRSEFNAEVEREPSGARVRWLGAIDLSGLGAVGLGGPAGGMGAGISGRWFFAPTLSLRIGAGFRRGEVETARANGQYAFGALGLGFTFVEAAEGKVTFGGRTDLLLGSYGLHRHSAISGTPEHQGRFLAGSDLLLESCWYLGKNMGLTLGLGAELAFGDTDVVVAGQAVADIAPVRAIAELGARARF